MLRKFKPSKITFFFILS